MTVTNQQSPAAISPPALVIAAYRYRDEGASVQVLADDCNVPFPAMYAALVRAGVPMRGTGEAATG